MNSTLLDSLEDIPYTYDGAVMKAERYDFLWDGLIKLAAEYHNPVNYDLGEDLPARRFTGKLFNEEIWEHLNERRFYFSFRGKNMTDAANVYKLFRNNKNFYRYAKVWVKVAPKPIQDPFIYLMMIVSISVKGFKNEDAQIAALRAAGHTVKLSTAYEDYNQHIDAWVDGEPVNFKSEKTIKGYSSRF